mgnify:CR=1 FL=1
MGNKLEWTLLLTSILLITMILPTALLVGRTLSVVVLLMLCFTVTVYVWLVEKGGKV